jgi:methylthioribose-1-phosphate isomerase
MVTQGGAQWIVAAYAVTMLAYRLEGKPAAEVMKALEEARVRLVATRPTNTSIAHNLARAMDIAKNALDQGKSVGPALVEWIDGIRERSYARSAKMGKYGAELIDDGDGVLTMCFAETSFLLALAFAHQSGKDIRVFVPETRPYLQGARLTAPSIHEIGVPVKLISDNMPAYVMSQGKIQKYFTAADLVTLDGHVVNKIGTFQNAVTAHYHHIPYFPFSMGADPDKPDRASIVIEERNPAEIRSCRGTPTTIDAIDAYYPAFDITPPHLVAGVITEYGVLSAYDLGRYFAGDREKEE